MEKIQTDTTKGQKKTRVTQNGSTKKNVKSKKMYKRIAWKDIKNNKKSIVLILIILIFIIYGVCKVIELIQNPTDTFTVEQGKIYQEESTTRIHYSRGNSCKRL